jgi:hypothetical protein
MEHLDALVSALLLVNGTYDVVCAACIVWAPESGPGRLHLGVFKQAETRGANRVFAYWVLTYGLDRMVAGVWRTAATDAIAVVSYLVESAAYEKEAREGSVYEIKARFVSVASLLLAGVVGVRCVLV